MSTGENREMGRNDEPEFEPFDVMQEPDTGPAEVEITAEALGGLAGSADQLAAVLQARDELERRLLIAPGDKVFAAAEDGPAGFGNVVGVGIGEREVGGHPTGQLAVKVFVKEKVRASDVSAEALAPDEVGGVDVDVDTTGDIFANRFVARLRPAPGGVSIGNCGVVHAGTMGCLVTRAGQLFILTNNHVAALSNTAAIGSAISQPGRLDGGNCPADTIGRLAQFVPIIYGTQCNAVDAAIVRTSPNLVDRRLLRPGGIRQPIGGPVVAPALTTLVHKSGRTTPYRRGLIDAINVTVDVSYAPTGGVARFCNQFRVRGTAGVFSDRGDSGSLVTTVTGNRPVGLLFAGNATNNVTFCNDIRRVLAAFGVTIVL